MIRPKLVRQPYNSSLCGQACIAMLTGLTIQQVVYFIGTRGVTNLKHFLSIELFTNKYNLSPKSKLIRTTRTRKIPKYALLRIKWEKEGYHSHWVIKWNELVFDPDNLSGGVFSHRDYMFNIAFIGRVTSFIELYK